MGTTSRKVLYTRVELLGFITGANTQFYFFIVTAYLGLAPNFAAELYIVLLGLVSVAAHS